MGGVVSIAGRKVGESQPCYIIAEAGSNHDGKIEQARRLVDIAAECGADAVKFQVFKADRIASSLRDETTVVGDSQGQTIHELYKSMELPDRWLPELASYCRVRGIEFLATPFDEGAADQLDAVGVAAFKVASFELVHLPLIRHIARKRKPMILSTGMGSLGEIEEAVMAAAEEGNSEVVLLHCGIGYPLKTEDVNLTAMHTLAQAFPYPVGYSDHTMGIAVPIAAVAVGARVIEKHFTITRKLKGPDHSFALEPGELKALVDGIKEVERAMGSPQKRVLDSERIYYARGRRSLFARVNIAKGTVVTRDMLAVLRPGSGLKPSFLEMVVGRKARTDITGGQPITWDKI